MKRSKLIQLIVTAAALIASVSAFAAPTVAPTANLEILAPIRIPLPHQIDPVFTAKFQAASKDYKTFHGSMCQPYNGDQQGDLDHRDNGLYNESAATRIVVCPIVRDNVHKKDGLWTYIYVNNPAGKTFSCWVDSRDKFGKLVKWVNKQTSLAGNRTLSIDVNKMAAHGNFNLYCGVPSKGRIASYETVELLRTDLNN